MTVFCYVARHKIVSERVRAPLSNAFSASRRFDNVRALRPTFNQTAGASLWPCRRQRLNRVCPRIEYVYINRLVFFAVCIFYAHVVLACIRHP